MADKYEGLYGRHNNYDKFFTVFETLDPPPIRTKGYEQVQQDYKRFMYDLPAGTPTTTNNRKLEQAEEIFHFPEEIVARHPVRHDGDMIDIVDTARQFVGTKYTWGGTTPSRGFDCSGLIRYAYMQHGIDLPRTAAEMAHIGKEVSLEDVQPGDIICTPGAGQSGKHVKMVSKILDNQIYTIEAKGKKEGIIETPLTDVSNIMTIRRVLNDGNNKIVDYFVRKGLTQNQARGIYGNIMQESNGNPKAVSHDGNNSYGLAQWTGDRKKRLFSMYGRNPSFNQQLDFLWWELNNTHQSVLARLRKAINVPEATKIIMTQFEKPNSSVANYKQRLKYAYS